MASDEDQNEGWLFVLGPIVGSMVGASVGRGAPVSLLLASPNYDLRSVIGAAISLAGLIGGGMTG